MGAADAARAIPPVITSKGVEGCIAACKGAYPGEIACLNEASPPRESLTARHLEQCLTETR
jgi:hypothetical protein